MTKKDLLYWVNLLAKPVLTALLGLVLLLNPDSVSTMIAKGAGWILVLIGAGMAFGARGLAGRDRVKRFAWAAVSLACGIWLLSNPLILAKTLGRFLGILLMVLGGQDIRTNLLYRDGKLRITPGLLMACGVALVGLILLLFPMTTSRIAFSVCGGVLLVIGVGEIIDRLRNKRYLDEGDDPNIIDAL